VLTGAYRDARVAFLGRRELPSKVEPEVAAERCRELLGLVPAQVAHNRQCHSTRIVAPGSRPVEADGLVTSLPDLALAVFTADCVPVLLAAPGAVAAIHAGWRGLAGGIVRDGARELATRAEAPTDRIVAWVGPCIGGCCYEVGEEVAGRVAAAATPDVVIPRQPRPHLDLSGAARAQLEAAGVEDVRWWRHCTACSSERWWSHRREAGRAGRNYSLVWRAGPSRAS
jgi:polyphenol oxidase